MPLGRGMWGFVWSLPENAACSNESFEKLCRITDPKNLDNVTSLILGVIAFPLRALSHLSSCWEQLVLQPVAYNFKEPNA